MADPSPEVFVYSHGKWVSISAAGGGGTVVDIKAGPRITVTDDGAGTFTISADVVDYADITGKPTIPTKVSELTNDLNFVDAATAKANAPVQTIVAGTNGIVVTDNGSGRFIIDGPPPVTSIAWDDVTGKPTFFSGDYNDLTNKPTIPDGLPAGGSPDQIIRLDAASKAQWIDAPFAPVDSPAFTGTVSFPAGTAAAPGFSFTGDPDTGITSGGGADSLAFIVGGKLAFNLATGGTSIYAASNPTTRATVNTHAFSVIVDGVTNLAVSKTAVALGENVYPITKGTAGQILQTDGAGTLSWADLGIDDLTDVDTTTTAPTDGQTLLWQDPTNPGDAGKWVPGTVDAGFTCADGTTHKSLDDVADFLRVFAGCSANQPVKPDGTQATGWQAVALKLNEYGDGSFDPDALVMAYDTVLDTTGNLDVVLPIGKVAVDPNVEIDWGDGGAKQTVTAAGHVSHTYAKAGRYVVSVKGTMDRWGFLSDEAKNVKLERCLSWGKTGLVNLEGALRKASKMNSFVPSPPKTVTVTSNMFRDCAAFNQPLSHFDTAAVTRMSNMFKGCVSFNQSVSTFDTSAVTSMSNMFSGCTKFNQSVSNFDTSAVFDMSYMFADCVAFNQPVANFNTSAVKNMSNMFRGCTHFNQSLSSFGTATVTSMGGMFYNCTAFNQSLSGFDTSKVTDMAYMFFGCASFNKDISNFTVQKISTAASTGLDLFMQGAAAFSTANLDKLLKAWDAAKAGNVGNNHHPAFSTACSGAGGGVAARNSLQAAGWTFAMPPDLP